MPIVNDPQIRVDLIRNLTILGELLQLEVLPAVLPVAVVDQPDFQVRTQQPLYLRGEISNANASSPAAGTVILDTGQLAAGDYDVQGYWTDQGVTVDYAALFSHRDAADAADIDLWVLRRDSSIAGSFQKVMDFAIQLLFNERIRVSVTADPGVGATVQATLMVKRRVYTYPCLEGPATPHLGAWGHRNRKGGGS